MKCSSKTELNLNDLWRKSLSAFLLYPLLFFFVCIGLSAQAADLVPHWKSDGTPANDQMRLFFSLENQDLTPADMSKVKVVYWLELEESSNPASVPNVNNCFPEVDCANAIFNIFEESNPAPGAEYRLEITFTGGNIAS
jgi:hypothetical protein